MLRIILKTSLIIFLLSSCNFSREKLIREKKTIVSSKVFLGDDIFSAKRRLEASGFRITYGPSYPTEPQNYLMMIVDYGARPSRLETIKDSLDVAGNGKLIYGIIKASPEGVVTSIE